MTTVLDLADPVLAQSSGGSGIFGLLIPLVLIFGVMYFLLIRPQQRRSQAQQRLMSEIEPGDEVVTIGGLFGDVVEVSDDRVLLEAYDGTQMEFLRSAIARRIVPEDAVDEVDVVDADEVEDTKALDAPADPKADPKAVFKRAGKPEAKPDTKPAKNDTGSSTAKTEGDPKDAK